MSNEKISTIAGAAPLGAAPSISTTGTRGEDVAHRIEEHVTEIVRPGILGRTTDRVGSAIKRNPLKSLGLTGLVAGAGGGAGYAYYARNIAGKAITVHAPRVAQAALRALF